MNLPLSTTAHKQQPCSTVHTGVGNERFSTLEPPQTTVEDHYSVTDIDWAPRISPHLNGSTGEAHHAVSARRGPSVFLTCRQSAAWRPTPTRDGPPFDAPATFPWENAKQSVRALLPRRSASAERLLMAWPHERQRSQVQIVLAAAGAVSEAQAGSVQISRYR